MRISFIAISGLRMADPRLLELGMTFPSVARRAKEIEALPSLGLLTIAGMTPADVEVEYLELRDVDHDALPLHFDAVALSTLSGTAKEALRLAARFRDHGIPVILGGLHATLAPDDCRPHVDCLIVGEGEPVWPEVVRDLQRGELQPLYDARPRGPFDFANAPPPRCDLLDADPIWRGSSMKSKGGPSATTKT